MERDVRWTGFAVGPNAEETAKAAGKAIVMATGVRGAEGQPGVIGEFFPQAAAAVAGLPGELRPATQRAGADMAATEEAAAYLNLPLMPKGVDPSGEMAKASSWAWRHHRRAEGGGNPLATPPRASLLSDFGVEPAFLAPGATIAKVAAATEVLLGETGDGTTLSERLHGAGTDALRRLALLVGVEMPAAVDVSSGAAAGDGVDAAAAVKVAEASARTDALALVEERLRQVLLSVAPTATAAPPRTAPLPLVAAAQTWEQQVQLSRQVETIRQIVALLVPLQEEWPELREALVERNQIPEHPLSLDVLASVAPASLMAILAAIRAQCVGKILLVEAVRAMADSADCGRIQGIIKGADTHAAAAVRAGGVRVALSPLSRVLHIFPSLQILFAVLGQPLVAFGVTGGGTAQRLYDATAVISFMDSARNLQLGPGAERLSAALAEVNRHPNTYVDVRRVMAYLVAAVAQARRQGGDYTALTMPSATEDQKRVRQFATWGGAAVEAQAKLAEGAVVSAATLRAFSRELTELAAHQAFELVQAKKVAGSGAVALDEQRIAALAMSMDDAQETSGVGGIYARPCKLTSGCAGQRRGGDPLCATCFKWETGAWACPKCGTVNIQIAEECRVDSCVGGVRPGQPVTLKGGVGEAAVARQLSTYAKREKREAQARQRAAGAGGGSGQRS